MPIALNELLRATSRSFYLTLRVLPGAIRPQIGLAYLPAQPSCKAFAVVPLFKTNGTVSFFKFTAVCFCARQGGVEARGQLLFPGRIASD
jgi:hypothetical protein